MTPDDRLAAAFERIAAVMERRVELEYPPVAEPSPAEVYNRHDAQEEPQSKEEYDAFESGEGRFQRLIAQATKTAKG